MHCEKHSISYFLALDTAFLRKHRKICVIEVLHLWDRRGFFHKGVPESGELEMGVVGERAV